MSRDLSFDDLPGGEKRQDEHYEPGLKLFSDGLVNAVVAPHYDGSVRKTLTGGSHRIVEEWADKFVHMIEPEHHEDFDANAFLDHVIQRLTLEPLNDSKDHFQTLGFFCSSLLQALYNLGHNDFIMDMEAPETTTLDMAKHLTGTKERLFTLKYSGMVGGHFGYRCRYSKLTLEGQASQIGTECSKSTIISSAIPAYDSVVYGYNAICCELDILNEQYELGSYLRDSIVCVPSLPAIRGVSYSLQTVAYWTDFFERRNELFIPDETDEDAWDQLFLVDGDWEVRS